jgi:hypothetical protein
VDTCQPDYNESEPSSSFTECVGAASCVFTVISTGGTTTVPGDEFRIDLQVCDKQYDDIENEVIYAQVCTEIGGGDIGPDADSIELIEDGFTGRFSINTGTYGGRDYVKIYDESAYPSSPTDLDLIVEPSGDTVTIGAYSDTGYSGSTCEGTFTCGEDTFPVEVDPCATDPVAPGAPTGLMVEVTDCDTATKPTAVTLSWEAATGTVTSYIVQSCKEQGGSCTWGTETTTTDTTASFTTDSRTDNSTWNFQVIAENDPTDECSDQSVVQTVSDSVTETCN